MDDKVKKLIDAGENLKALALSTFQAFEDEFGEQIKNDKNQANDYLVFKGFVSLACARWDLACVEMKDEAN